MPRDLADIEADMAAAAVARDSARAAAIEAFQRGDASSFAGAERDHLALATEVVSLERERWALMNPAAAAAELRECARDRAMKRASRLRWRMGSRR